MPANSPGESTSAPVEASSELAPALDEWTPPEVSSSDVESQADSVVSGTGAGVELSSIEVLLDVAELVDVEAVVLDGLDGATTEEEVGAALLAGALELGVAGSTEEVSSVVAGLAGAFPSPQPSAIERESNGSDARTVSRDERKDMEA